VKRVFIISIQFAVDESTQSTVSSRHCTLHRI